MKAIDTLHRYARVINEIDDINDLNIRPKYTQILIKQIVQDWRDAI